LTRKKLSVLQGEEECIHYPKRYQLESMLLFKYQSIINFNIKYNK
jgi:hypothetical protein